MKFKIVLMKIMMLLLLGSNDIIASQMKMKQNKYKDILKRELQNNPEKLKQFTKNLETDDTPQAEQIRFMENMGMDKEDENNFYILNSEILSSKP